MLETALVGVEWWGQREEETANQSNWTSTLLWGHTLGYRYNHVVATN